jgi:uncharacterized membrane protein HdeD (DUF308 family)
VSQSTDCRDGKEDVMLTLLARNWWLIVLRGVCAIVFGLLAWMWPGVTLGALVFLWAFYAFADGILAIAAALSGSTGAPAWSLILSAFVSIGAAVVAFIYPGMTAVVLVYVIALWAIVTGVMQIVAAIRLRKEIDNEVWLGLAGLASVVLGLILFARPGVGALAVVWLIGTYAVLFGVLLVVLGFRVKGLPRLAQSL